MLQTIMLEIQAAKRRELAELSGNIRSVIFMSVTLEVSPLERS